MSKNVLISGGAGFLGSYMCDHYVEQGDNVTCLDNLSTGSENNIKGLLSKTNFEFINHDIVQSFPQSVLDKKYDIVINLASPASPPR